MIYLRHLFGITKLDKEKNRCIRKKNGSTESGKGNKTVSGKLATTHTEDGYKQNTKTSVTI
jgi:hypothetical protein